ncbi:hypothetical protein SGQ44_05905 [Flavobacterium sp. Fl-77]|uniref:Uncharacterized protein n=1 Tax=Flavobacterium flavipigmentatum TaxID=2893884 RepID=A0AAJ2SF23_9FLAO|nr:MULTISPECIES: hypothetical protein [unclassified Flavobacterium]MDX6181685.1 hypothetical protein [Flavobacterium sp. Fl-33]MDX6185281.1 hypothetical protein [Flavobacterium sp. Fl-77]UFH37387.1 hypothetical protein LNP22_11635 [Flavobacterium sp. F-70]
MNRLLFLIIILVLNSCKKESNVPSISNDGVEVVKSVSKVIKKRNFTLSNFSKIELISYYDRIAWDTIEYKNKEPFAKDLVDNYKLTFDSTMIEERVTLNKKQEKELLNLMVCDTCIPEEMSSACYRPRHMILFRDSKNRIIAYNEFCMSCNGARNSANLDGFQKYCLYEMGDLFRKFGIKLFVDYADEQKEYEVLRKKGY